MFANSRNHHAAFDLVKRITENNGKSRPIEPFALRTSRADFNNPAFGVPVVIDYARDDLAILNKSNRARRAKTTIKAKLLCDKAFDFIAIDHIDRPTS